MRYRIEHHTTLVYEKPVLEQACELRLLPRETDYQKPLAFELEVDPATRLFSYSDGYGNTAHHFTIVGPHDRLAIRFRAEVENTLSNPFNYIPPSPEEERGAIVRLLREQPRVNDFVLSISDTAPTLAASPRGLAWPDWDPRHNLLEAAQAAMAWIGENFRYLPGSTQVHCPFTEFLEKRAGVCQDFAHLLIAVVRRWGVPARYVMGYQYLPPESDEIGTPATHAWVEIFLPGRGWQGFDATQQLLANDAYIPVAVGRDSHDAAPQRGCYKGGAVGEEPVVELSVVGQQ